MDRLLLATDFSTGADRALRRAALIADRFGAALTLLHVIDDQLDPPVERRREAASTLLTDAVGTIERFDRVSADMRIATGDAASIIVKVADEIGAAMIVIGPHRRTLKDIFVGSTAERTIGRSTRPVLMANGMPSGAYERTFVALDFDDASRAAVAAARELDILEGTMVTVMHAFDAPGLGMMKRGMEVQDSIDNYVAGVEQKAQRAFDAFLAEIDLRPDRRLLKQVEGSPVRAIVACAEGEDAELIIVGTNRRKGAERWLLRSVAQGILREAERDVLVVPTESDMELSLEQ